MDNSDRVYYPGSDIVPTANQSIFFIIACNIYSLRWHGNISLSPHPKSKVTSLFNRLVG